MATYDPQKARRHKAPAADEPAAVDALLGPDPASPAKPDTPVQPLADAKLRAKVEVKAPAEPGAIHRARTPPRPGGRDRGASPRPA